MSVCLVTVLNEYTFILLQIKVPCVVNVNIIVHSYQFSSALESSHQHPAH